MSVFAKRWMRDIRPPYTELKYIEATGTQYVNADLMIDQNTKVEMEIQLTNTSITQFVFGSRNGGSYGDMAVFYQKSSKKIGADYSPNSQRYLFSVTPTEKLTIVFNKNIVTINGEKYTFTAMTFEALYNFTIFALNIAGNIGNMAQAKLYKCKIYKNNVLIRDYIPAQMKISGEVGLWEKVDDLFYGNSGTGVFIAGEIAA